MDGVAYQWERLDRLLDDGLDDIAREHWHEVGLNKDRIPFDPNYLRFMEMEDKGLFKIMAARRGGTLVGYNGFFTMPHLHYWSSFHALNDVIYVDPDERGWTGIRLIREAEKLLLAMGVKKIMYHSKLHVKIGHGRTVGDLLAALGYVHVENVYAKVM